MNDEADIQGLIPIPIILAMVLMMLYIPYAHPNSAGISTKMITLILTLSIIGYIVIYRFYMKRSYVRLSDGEIYNIVMELAAYAGVTVRKVVLWRNDKPGVYTDASSMVIITSGAIDNFDVADTRVLVAHELAHIKLGHWQRQRTISYTVDLIILSIYFIISLLIGRYVDKSAEKFLRGPIIYMLLMGFINGYWLSRGKKARDDQAYQFAVGIIEDPKQVTHALAKMRDINDGKIPYHR